MGHPMILKRYPTHIIPQKRIKSFTLLNLLPDPRIANGSFNLATMTNDAGILQKAFDVIFTPSRDDIGVEPFKRCAEILSLSIS